MCSMQVQPHEELEQARHEIPVSERQKKLADRVQLLALKKESLEASLAFLRSGRASFSDLQTVIDAHNIPDSVSLDPENIERFVRNALQQVLLEHQYLSEPLLSGSHTQQPFWWYEARRKLHSIKSIKIEQLSATSTAMSESMRAASREYEQVMAEKRKSGPAQELVLSELMGKVRWTPADFSFTMNGIALIASYLSEKKRLQNFLVADTLESFSNRLKEIATGSYDGRYAFIVPGMPSGSPLIRGAEDLAPNAPQHKLCVCVEKIGHEVKIAVLDPMVPKLDFVDPDHFLHAKTLWEGFGKEDEFSVNELMLRAIVGAKSAECSFRVAIVKEPRETAFGCAVFALSDAEVFLGDPTFFDRSVMSRESVYVSEDEGIDIRYLDALPPDYMIGIQSMTSLKEYQTDFPNFAQETFARGKSADFMTLDAHVKHHLKVVDSHPRNQFIMWKMYEYTSLVLHALVHLPQDEIDKKIRLHTA